jgi:two-component system, OmpR family, sensor histidine kinase MtrB
VSDSTGTVAAEPRPPDETPDGAGADELAPGTVQGGPAPDAGGTGADPTTPFPRPETARRDRPIRGFLRRLGLVGLRRRILLTFTLGSLTLSAFLAVTTYGLVRSNLIEQRYAASRQAAYTDASTVQRELRSGPPTLAGASEQLRRLGVQRPVIYYRGTWSAGISRFGYQEIPPALVARVLKDETDARMITKVGKNTVMVIGVPIPGIGAYFEFFDLSDDDQTLSNVALSLFLASVITTLLGVLLGVFAARRAVRPVAEAAQAAKAIAGGHLGTRLPPSDDPDLGVLAGSFNDMASALQVRIERDARFASDVSHELRSPLMTLSASVEVMEARRSEMPERAQAALDLLSSDVSRFKGLVEDLLEISRFDAGAIRLHLEDLHVSQFVRNAVAVSSAPSSTVTVNERAEGAVIRGDRRRLARVLANLIDNAEAYGGGDAEVAITDANLPDEPLTHIRVTVEDHGPGVPVEERALIFERFSRGATAGRRAGSEGAGLGLALVDEHVRIHGGRVWVEDRLDGEPGARFVIELPAVEPPAAEDEQPAADEGAA